MSITDQEIIDSHLATGEDLDPDRFPELATLSAAHVYQFTPVAKCPAKPEVVFIPRNKMKRHHLVGVLAMWNDLWEASQFRGEVFRSDRYRNDLPEVIAWIKDLPASNIYLVADTTNKYEAYSPLYHLLPKRLLDRHRLPSLRRPLWPNNTASPWYDAILPADLSDRLSRAFAEHIWSHIDSGSGLRAFSDAEPLRLLSHNLDFWLPYTISAIEGLRHGLGRAELETEKQRLLHQMLRREAEDEDVSIERPRRGGVLWMGEAEAADVTKDIFNAADKSGQLRGIMEAIRCNRVVDDFSSCWSFAREDFERKLYSKRSKVKISFVELKDTLPVHSATSEYTDDLIWQDFSALLDTRERHIVVCLRNGTSNLGDIGARLGYANHSPVSKALTRIRKKAKDFLDLN